MSAPAVHRPLSRPVARTLFTTPASTYRARSWPRPRIVGHRSVAARFDRYRATLGYNGLINARQFSIQASWPTEYDYPDTVYDQALRLETDGVVLELQHARGETDDAETQTRVELARE